MQHQRKFQFNFIDNLKSHYFYNRALWLYFCLFTLALAILSVWSPENYDPDSNVIQKKIFASFVIAVSLCCFSLLWFLNPKLPTKLDKFDLLVILYLGVQVLINHFNNANLFFSFNAQVGVILILFCTKLTFFQQLSNKTALWAVFAITQLAFLSQALYGLVQYLNSAGSSDASMNTTGSFHNSGILGCYLTVSVISAIEALFYLSPRKQNLSAISAIVASIAVTSTVIILTQSRIAWVASLAGLFSIFFFRPNSTIKENFSKIPMPVKVASLITALIAIVSFTYWLYGIKERSAQGRALIWKINLDMIRDNPIWGYGENGFSKHYGLYQARHFLSNDNPIQKSVAGNPATPFSDYMGILIKYGIIGFSILLLLIRQVFTSCKNEPFLKPTLIACLVLALTSYTMDGMPTLISLFLVLFACSWSLRRKYDLNPRFIRCGAVFLGAYSILLLNLTSEANHLNQLSSDVHRQLYMGRDNAVPRVVDMLARSESLIASDAALLAIYGKSLALLNKHEEAIQKYRSALSLRSDFSIFDNLGISYQSLRQYDAARNAFLLSHNMVPNRLRSQYLITKLYVETNKLQEARVMGHRILDYKDRVMSYQSYLYKEEIKKILNEIGD